MKSKKVVVFPRYQKNWDQLGENIKLARNRRKLTAIQLAERAAIERVTLRKIERSDPSVSMSAYFSVLKALNLHEDFLKLAVDDELGRKLQDLDLLT